MERRMSIEELEQRIYEIRSRAQVRRSLGDDEGARIDEQTVKALERELSRRKRVAALRGARILPGPTDATSGDRDA